MGDARDARTHLPARRVPPADDVPVTAETVKCPTCGQKPGIKCIALGTAPDGRIVWRSVDPHPGRQARMTR